MKNRFTTPLKLYDVCFVPLRINAAEFIDLFCNPLTWRYLGIVFLILLVADPAAMSSVLPPFGYVAASLGAFVLYLAVQCLLMLGLAVIRQHFPEPGLYFPLLSAAALVPVLAALGAALDMILPEDVSKGLNRRLGFIAATTILFEALFMRFVLPRLRAEDPRLGAKTPPPAADQAPATGPQAAATVIPQADPFETTHASAFDRAAKWIFPINRAVMPQTKTHDEPGTQEKRLIHVGGQSIALDDISLIEAQEHHVILHTSDGPLTYRARLSDILAQVGPDDGIQPHRSFWVARHVVQEVAREAGKPVLKLEGHAPLPVARGRLADVRDWLDANCERATEPS
ncbi:hypothetical protein GCM10011415_25530 [Salipiger pallidus]|uniref:HTH LytTR-type domain-containing protein n=2 Tax=Salipiger pallidus TaxID=1775170 RepID=A0A8J3EHN7_9RHOB|nr:hypothetical protein GCM10011415_25530 [Salipiger pallidus]